MKHKTIFSCSKCDAQFPKWTGQCLECQSWGSVSESVETQSNKNTPKLKVNQDNVINFSTFQAKNDNRDKTNITEVDRVLGGGFVQGSLSLLGGEPGIGKSTLVLQLSEFINQPILYASGEESATQIKLRVDRLGFKLENLNFIAENNVETIIAHTLNLKPTLLIIDSIQTIYSNELPTEAGGINQVRTSTVKLLELAKQNNITVLIIGHVTKEGSVAGPKTLEHLVDTVLYLEGSKKDSYRILRATKNRFGSTDEIGIFEMTGKGLIEVKNPSELFFSSSELKNSGNTTTILLEGTRPFVVEIQALVTKTHFGYPQRKTSGYDLNRLQMLIAVLIKRAGLKLENQDVHLNITGGFKINETVADGAVCASIYTSLKDIKLDKSVAIIGEVGLGGELRNVQNINKRIEEAQRLNIEKIIIPKHKNISNTNNIIQVTTIKEALDLL